MKIDRCTMGPAILVTVEGVVLLKESGKKFSSFLQNILETELAPVVIDLSRIDEVDSTGIGELAGYLQMFGKAGRKMVVIRPAPRIRRLFHFMNLDKVLPIFDDLDTAIAAVTS